jgi:hypothetical protein
MLFCAIPLAAAVAVWMFAAGWAGRVAILPDSALLTSGEWFIWAAVFVLMWGPVAAAVWCGWRAVKEKNSNAAD